MSDQPGVLEGMAEAYVAFLSSFPWEQPLAVALKLSRLGLLAQAPTTLGALEGVAERLLVDAIEPIEELARGA